MLKTELKQINFRLWLVLMVSSFIPLIYSTTRIHFIGSMPDSWSLSIAAQVAWLNIGYEVIGEALMLPLAFILGQAFLNPVEFRKRAISSFAIIVLVYAIMTAFVVHFTPQLVTAMQQNSKLLQETIVYIRLEALAIFISSGYMFMNLLLVLYSKYKALYTLLVIQTVLTVFCDSVLVSQLPFSYKLGVNGIAVTNILVNSLLVFVALQLLKHNGIKLSYKDISFKNQVWLRLWFNVGSKSGIESFVRNTAFVVMILQLMNQLQQAGTFWVANGFIWGWLLLPILTLGQVVKRDAATNNGLSEERINSYLMITLGVVALWLLTIPFWESFVHNVIGISNASEVTHLVVVMIGFYVVFAFNNVIDSYFYGIGRTDLMLYQSLIVNTLFYGAAYISYQQGVFVPSLNKIAIMFGLGITLDAVITWLLYRMVIKQTKTMRDVSELLFS
ncbi:MATE family Na+-driven efflux transporter [Marinomonas dokdonensis]|uniref:MATE family Na+-driven efflux transporter n=1 Tax=Marinomonas dokdonensis TaxID=328224 RepID=UPI0040558A11